MRENKTRSGNKTPRINIIIVTLNQFMYVQKCLDSIYKSNAENVRIYIVDNNSDKKEYHRFVNLYKKKRNIIHIRLKKNIGFGPACNVVLRTIKSGYVIFLNNDTVVTKNWLSPLIDYMEKNLEVGAVQPKVKSMKQRQYFEHAGAGGGFMDVYGYPFCRGRIFFTVEKDSGQYNDVADVLWTSGSCMVTHADVLKKVGLFDDIFFMYAEEADLCWRMYKYGYKLKYIPQSTIFHYGSATIGKDPHWKVFFHHRNGLIMLIKNYRFTQLLLYLPVRILLDIITFWYYLLNWQTVRNAMALVKAYIHVLIDFPRILKSRASVKDARLSSIVFPLYKRSIVIDYFIFKKKIFRELNMMDSTI